MKALGIFLIIVSFAFVETMFASESTRTIEVRFDPTDGDPVFAKINGHLNDTIVGSSATLLLQLPNGDLRLLKVRSIRTDDPTFVNVTVSDPRILIEEEDSQEPLRIFLADVKLTDSERYDLIETNEGVYSIKIVWNEVQNRPGKTK